MPQFVYQGYLVPNIYRYHTWYYCNGGPFLSFLVWNNIWVEFLLGPTWYLHVGIPNATGRCQQWGYRYHAYCRPSTVPSGMGSNEWVGYLLGPNDLSSLGLVTLQGTAKNLASRGFRHIPCIVVGPRSISLQTCKIGPKDKTCSPLPGTVPGTGTSTWL